MEDYNLMAAVWASDIEAAKLEIEQGASPNASTDGYTVLLKALSLEDKEMVVLLLEAGADPNIGHPLEDVSDLELVRLLIDAGAKIHWDGKTSALHNAASSGDLELIKLLVSRCNGAFCLDLFNDLGHTPLGAAVWLGHTEAARYLLEMGSDPNLCDPDQIAYTPLVHAARNPELVRLLLEAGADPDHSWGLCQSGRDALMERGGEVQRLLEESDRHPDRRRVVRES